MDIHERLMNLQTLESTILDILVENPEQKSNIIQELLRKCVAKGCVKNMETRYLETCRILLCYQYQSLIKSGDEKSVFSSKNAYIDLKKYFIEPTEDFANLEEFSTIYDIDALQLSLYCDNEGFLQHFTNFHDAQKNYLTQIKNKNLCMRVYECVVDTCILRSHLYKKINFGADFEELRHCVVSRIQTWLDEEENLEWQLLASLLQKLANLFGPQKTVAPIWNKVVNDWQYLDKTLIILCIMSDIYFSCEEDNHLTGYDYCLRDEFWLILLQGLESPIYQERKQSLYLMKAALDFIESLGSEISKSKGIEQIEGNLAPFLGTNSLILKDNVKQAKINFFLILESLEEKQKHFVLPALTHLDTLIRLYSEQKAQGCNFHTIWLHCILKRIVSHDNNAVKITGLREILKADLEIYNEDFMFFLTRALNNLHLYEYNPPSDAQPEIVTQLVDFFLRSENAGMPLINNFVQAMTKVSWCPVAIYWVLRAIVGVTEHVPIVYNIWTSDVLECIQHFVETNLTKYDRSLQVNAQWLMLQAFFAYNNYENMGFAIFPNLITISYECFLQIVQSTDENNLQKIVKYLKNLIQPEEAQSYALSALSQLTTSRQSIQANALCFLLLNKSQFIWESKHCLAKTHLYALFENLKSVNSRPYADTTLIGNIINLMYHFNKIIRCIPELENPVINSLTFEYRGETLQLIESSFEKTSKLSYSDYLKLVEIAEISREKLEVFVQRCEKIICNSHEVSKNQWIYVIKFLHFCKLDNILIKQSIGKCIPKALQYLKNEKFKADHRDKLFVESANAIAVLVSQFLKSLSKEEWLTYFQKNLDWLQELQYLVESRDEAIIIPIIDAINTFNNLEGHVCSEEKKALHTLIRTIWSFTFDMKRTKLFWDVLRHLMRLLMNRCFMLHEENMNLIVEYADLLIEEGKTVPMFLYLFLGGMHDMDPVFLLLLRRHFLSCLLHEPTLRYDEKIVQATMANLRSFKKVTKDTSPEESIEQGVENRDIHSNIRGLALTILLRTLEKGHSNETYEFLQSVVMDILSVLEKYQNKRYFNNSFLHRLKNRAMQILLTVQPHLKKKDLFTLRDKIFYLLIIESNQPSVRLMKEWLIVSILIRTDDYTILEQSFCKAQEIRPGSIISLSGIAFHYAKLLSGVNKKKFIDTAVSLLFPNCMSQQFNIRLYSQVILVKLCEMLPKVPEQYSRIYNGVKESLTHGNLVKNVPKIMESFYFAAFRVTDSIPVIYHYFPRLTDIPSDEWFMAERDVYPRLVINALETHDYSDKNEEVLKNWPMSISGTQSERVAGEFDEDADQSVTSGLSDIQKKVIPWKSMFPLSEELLEILPKRTDSNNLGIIVVASLVEKSANLGGIARTCEILGVKELVIHSLKCVENKEFQTLSVSAEKWIKITEVKPHLLKNYLLEQRFRGWKLVGAEQTVNSTNLLDMEFDKKTILLLGNEKNGIPANLIPILDTCVEIPQNGVVRSLNVHVTSAICVWQYAKQHNFS